jgi:hypothetical protein
MIGDIERPHNRFCGGGFISSKCCFIPGKTGKNSQHKNQNKYEVIFPDEYFFTFHYIIACYGIAESIIVFIIQGLIVCQQIDLSFINKKTLYHQ